MFFFQPQKASSSHEIRTFKCEFFVTIHLTLLQECLAICVWAGNSIVFTHPVYNKNPEQNILWQEKVYTRKSAFVLIFKSFLHKQLHSTTKIFRESFENLECAKIIEKLAILPDTTGLGVGVGAAADHRLGEVICHKSQIFKK